MIEGRGMDDGASFRNSPPSFYRRTKVNRRLKARRKAALVTIIAMLLANIIMVITLIPTTTEASKGIEQRVEPAIVLGSQIPDFYGTSVDDIWVYAWVEEEWKQIPFQIDERNDVNGSYFIDAVDDVLDDNDEIVFMPFDAGDSASNTNWAPNTEFSRYEISVLDPIDSSIKYAYIYNSSSLTKTFTEDYVDYDPAFHIINAAHYTIGFDEIHLGIMDEMSVTLDADGDETDMLDRSKYRLQKTIDLFIYQCYEEDFYYNLIGYKDGPVRVIRQVTSQNINDTEEFSVEIDNTLYAYRSYLKKEQTLNTNTSTDWLRVTLDFLSISSNRTYYDSNLNELTIDGIPDSPGSVNSLTWAEVTSDNGTIIYIENFSEAGGTQSLYYNDNENSDDSPESEAGEYGNFGIMINEPENSWTAYTSYYLLGANQQNVGAKYTNYTNKPLEIGILPQDADPTPPPEIMDIVAIPDIQETGDYVNVSAEIEDNLNQLDGAWIEILDPNDVTLGNFSMSHDSNTNRYFHNRTYGIVGTYKFTIFASDFDDNWNSSEGQFIMQDTTLPTITDLSSFPDPQEADGFVNISVQVTDADLYGVLVEIKDQAASTIGNFSMIYDSSSHRYYDNRAYGSVGTYTFTVFAFDTSNNWNSMQGQFMIQDTTFPIISELTSIPNPQEAYGHVNISATVTDAEVHSVWIEVEDPKGITVGNFSMNYDSGTNKYYYIGVYGVIGTYTYTLWVDDTSGNWNSSFGQFIIQDTTLPTMGEVTTFPEIQEVFGNVNISLDVTDLGLSGVWIEIRDPDGSLVGNHSMVFDAGSGKYYDNRAYNLVGTYTFRIWANDTEGNWNSSQGQFVIQDTTPPLADAGSDQEVTEGTTVVFDGSDSTDNVGIVSYKWTFTDGTIQTLSGITPSYTFNSAGSYVVTLNVSDAHENFNTDTMLVNVNEIIMTGSISGNIRDENNYPIIGATVSLIGDTTYETTTDDSGYYMLSEVNAGVYDMEVTKNGYGTEIETGVVVIAGQDRLNEDFGLEQKAQEESGSALWIVLIAIIVLIIILVIVVPRLRKEMEKETYREKLFEEPTEPRVAVENAEKEDVGETLWKAVEQTAAVDAYESTDDTFEGIEPMEAEVEEEDLPPPELGGLDPEILDIEKELDELLRDESKQAEPKDKKDLKDEFEALSEEIDKILNGTDEEDIEGED
ncbi:MAG: carboxypeptidase regulatory-like domain-containing protein [Thermoplasmata archaeon]|nr:MAG: carboxypeptidase regulatory-like domain-containing protein [Thermoplasmata archaeon]